MSRRFVAALTAWLVLVPLLAACASSGPSAAEDLRIYQVLPVEREKSKFRNGPGEGEAIALVNTGTKAHTISGWTVASTSGAAALPKVAIKPGEVIYLAYDAEYFRQYWNFAPHYEYGVDADKSVSDLKLPEQKAPLLKDAGDVVRLLDAKGHLVDILAYGLVGNPPLPWTGPPVQLVDSFPVKPENQVITRLKRGGTWLKEPAAGSFSGGTPTEPRRVFFAGQSDFPVKTVSGQVTLIAASAPDNAGPVLFSLVDAAAKSIRLTGYQYNNKILAERLIAAAKRGIKVQVAIDRHPADREPFDSDKEAHELLHRGGVELVYYTKWDGQLSSRFNPVHAKYGIIDDEWVMVSTGNYTHSVFHTDPSCGNREWLAFIKGSPDLVRLIDEVWKFDFASGHAEVRGYEAKLDKPLEPDTYDPGPCIPYSPVKPQPLTVSGSAVITRILSPDNTMDTEKGFLGVLRNAKQELWITANYINKWWGPASEPANMTRFPQPYLTEIVAAARRGVDVKVLFDRRNTTLSNVLGNHHVTEYLNDLANREKLKLEARLINMDGSGIGRTFHTKSFIVDGAVVISSINGSHNSFRYARELALKIEGVPDFTQYYRDIFLHDWEASFRPNYPWNVMAVPRVGGSFIDWSPNVELDVTMYEVYYKPRADGAWVKLGETRQPGFEDMQHERGIWGVIAVNKKGARSNFAEARR